MTAKGQNRKRPRRFVWLKLGLAAAVGVFMALAFEPSIDAAFADPQTTEDDEEDAPVRRERRPKSSKSEKLSPQPVKTVKPRATGGIIGGLGEGTGSQGGGSASAEGAEDGPDFLDSDSRAAGKAADETTSKSGGGSNAKAGGGGSQKIAEDDKPAAKSGDRPTATGGGSASESADSGDDPPVSASLTYKEKAQPDVARGKRSSNCDSISLMHGVQCVATRIDQSGRTGGTLSSTGGDDGDAVADLDIDIKSILTSSDGERTFNLTLEIGKPILALPENMSAKSRRQVVGDMAIVMARLRKFSKMLTPKQSRRLKLEKKVTLRLRSPFAGLRKLRLVNPVRVPVRYRAGVKLRVVDLGGKPLKSLMHRQAFRVEAKFSAPVEDDTVVHMSWEDSEVEIEIDLSPVFDDRGRISQQRMRSDVLYLRSRQFSNRVEHDGLFQDDRYYESHSLTPARKTWRTGTGRSEPETARRFKGVWHVSHVEGGGAKAFGGMAVVAEDGKSANLVLIDEKGFKRYTSVEIRTLVAAAGDPSQLEVRFERVRNLPAKGADSAGLEPLLKARFLDLPTLTDQVRFTLRDVDKDIEVELEPAPEERFRVLLTERAPKRLAGAWNEERPNGSYGASGHESWARESKIRKVLVLDDQLRRKQLTKAHYPYGRNRSKGAGRRRTLFVYGSGLPASYGDAQIVISANPAITYSPRFLDEGAGFTAADGWALARKADKEFTKPEDYSALFLIADFDDTTIPGANFFTLNGASAGWLLTFADATAKIYFTEVPPPEGTPTDSTYSSSVVHLEARLETEFPFTQGLTVEMHRNGEALVTSESDGKQQPVQVTLSKLTGEAVAADPGKRSLAGLIYRSGPIHLYRSDQRARSPPTEKGAVRIDMRPATGAAIVPKKSSEGHGPAAVPVAQRQRGNAVGTLTATWDTPEVLRIPRPASLVVYDKPADLGGTVWREALRTARACYDGGEHLDIQSQADELSRFVITEIFSSSNLGRGARKLVNPDDPEAAALSTAAPGVSIIREAGTRRVPLALGDHAAALLLRDEFKIAAKQKSLRYQGLLNLGVALDKFISRAMENGPSSDPLWQTAKVEIDGDDVPLKSLLNLKDVEAKHSMLGYSGPRDFLGTQTRKAMNASIKAIDASISTTVAKGDCDLEHLLVVSARKAPDLVAAILPRLVLLKDDGRKQWWAADVVARGYVSTLHTLGSAVRALDAYASLDKAVAALALAAVTGVGALALSQVGALSTAAYVTLAADLIDVAAFGTYSVVEYVEKQDDVDFALGASAVLGADIYLEAEAGDPSEFWTAAGILLPGLGVLGSLGDLKALRNIDRGAEVARTLGRIDEAALARLSEPDAKAFLAYLNEMKALQTLLRKGGLDGATKRLLRLNRKSLTKADEAFLGRYDDFLKVKKAQIDKGYEVARLLDDLDPKSIAKLTDRQHADLTTYINDIRTRQAALNDPAAAAAAGRIQLVSEREANLVAKLGDAIDSRPKITGKKIKIAQAEPGPKKTPTDEPGPKKPPTDEPGPKKDPADEPGPKKDPADEPGPKKDPADEPGPKKDPADEPGPKKDPADEPGPKKDPADEPGPKKDPADEPGPKKDPADEPGPKKDPADEPGPKKDPADEPGPKKDPADEPGPKKDPADEPGPKKDPADDPNATKDPADGSSPKKQPAAESIPVRDARTGELGDPIPLGKKIGSGSYNDVYRVEGRPKRVARVSKSKIGSLDEHLDEFGREVVVKIDSPHVRVPERDGLWVATGGAKDGRRVEVVEFIPWRAKEQIAANPGGLPTPGQTIALDKAKRAFNQKGYAWLDNHRGNYGFEPLAGKDEWRIVVFDTGGIVKAVDDGPGAAANARTLQRALDAPDPEDLVSLMQGIKRDNNVIINAASGDIRNKLLSRFGDLIDREAMGIARDAKIGFRGDGMASFPKVRQLSDIEDASQLERARDLLRDDPLAASGVPFSRLEDAKQTVRERGLKAFDDMDEAEAKSFKYAADRVAKKLKNEGPGSLTGAEREFADLAEGLGPDIVRADAAWRNAPPPSQLPGRNLVEPRARKKAIADALAEAVKRGDQAELRKSLVSLSRDSKVADQAGTVADSANDLAFRRKLLNQLDEARGNQTEAASQLPLAERRLKVAQEDLAKIDPADPAQAANRERALENVSALEKDVAKYQGLRDDADRVLKGLSERDLEWLSGQRKWMTPGEEQEALAALQRNKSRWNKMLKDDDLSLAQRHQLTAYRKAEVDRSLDRIIAEVEAETGRKIKRLAFGSNNLNSDYDLSIKIAGGRAGTAEVVRRFNNEFRARHGSESGVVFDTNVYTEPAYSFFAAAGKPNARPLSPVQEDVFRQTLYKETANRRYMTDAQWDANKASMLDGASPDEARALRHAFERVEGNYDSVSRALEADMAKAAGGQHNLDAMRNSLDAAKAEGADKAADTIGADLKQLEMMASNERYADILQSVDEFMEEFHRLNDANPDALRSGAFANEANPNLARAGQGKGSQSAYGKALERMRELSSEAEAVRRAGGNADDLIRQAETLRQEWLGRMAEQIRNRQGQALFFASEAYQTDGAIRHVVGELQAGGRKITTDSLSAPPVASKLTPDQYFDSFSENRANMFKEMTGARNSKTGEFDDPRKASAKASKYFIRQLDAAHQGGLKLSELPDQRVIEATVAVEAVRGDLDQVARVLNDLGLDAKQFAEMAETASNALNRQVFRQGALRKNAKDIAGYARDLEREIADF